MKNRGLIAAMLLALLAFLIPIEYQYDKFFRHFSLTLIPDGLDPTSRYEKKIALYISDFLILGLVALVPISLKRFFSNSLWLVLLFAFLSILASPFAAYPIPYLHLIHLLTPIALVSYFANTTEDVKKVTRWILIALVAAGCLQSLIGIGQYFNEGPIGVRFLHETKEVGSTIHIPDASLWLLDAIFPLASSSLDKMRAMGTLTHANSFGGFILLTLLANYALFMLSERKLSFLKYLLPLQIFALFISYSRSALFGWILASALWFAILYFQGDRKRLRSLFTWSLVSMALCTGLLYNQLLHRGGIFNNAGIAKGSDQVRVYYQNVGFDIVKSSPLFGLGYTQYFEQAERFISKEGRPDLFTVPHNIFLLLACETGLFSAGALLFALLTLLWRAIRTPITIEMATFFSLLIAFLFIGCCDCYPLVCQSGRLMFFLVAALLAAQLPGRKREIGAT